MELKIDKDFENCLPALSTEEYNELEKSIVKNGVISPIVVWNGTIVDGHNRYKICQSHRIVNIPTKELSFSSKDEAILWILKNQLGRRNLTDFQRNQIALKYEETIAEQMKEKQREAGGDKVSERAKSGVDQMIHSGQSGEDKEEKTTKRKELAKIAGTSEGSIQRTKLILEKGTPEQIDRAEKGGKGNSMSAIAREIEMEQKGVETKKCSICCRILPASEFEHGRSTCKKCRNQQVKNYKIKDFKGNKIEIAPEIARLTEEEIIGDLYDTDKVIDFTTDDFEEELNALIKNFSWSVQNCLKMHEELLRDEKSKEQVLGNLTLLQSEITKWKELYDYE